MAIRVLLVDDEADMRMLLRLTLDQTDDIEVVGEAASGLEAIDLVKALAPDLILLDQMMPGMTGLETAKAMFASDAGGALRIVIFSAYAGQWVRDAAEEAGVHRCLSKDEFAEIADVIREVAA